MGDLVWAQGFQWGFENCRYLTVNRDRYNIDPTTVDSDFLILPFGAIDELVDIGRDLLPDAPEVSVQEIYLVNVDLPPNPPGPEVLVDDDEIAPTPEPNPWLSFLAILCRSFFFFF